MATANIALLPDRGIVRVAGPDAAKLLQGVITNDMTRLVQGGGAIHAGLLSPQGKILFDFFVVPGAGGFLLETRRDMAGELAKKLMLYKLRAAVEIKDVSADHTVAALWGTAASTAAVPGDAIRFSDPRHEALGCRIVVSFATDWVVGETGARPAPAEEYHAHRIALGIPEGGRDYVLGDTFPHEADFDLYGGVSFTKGCFVGQEVVSRMENKAVVRKRVVRVAGDGLAPGAGVHLGDVVVGTVGSVAGEHGLALVKLDRVSDALEAGQELFVGGAPVEVAAEAIARYRASVAEKAASGP